MRAPRTPAKHTSPRWGRFVRLRHGDGSRIDCDPGSVPLAADGPGIERLALDVGGRNLGVLVLRGELRELSVADHRILRAFSDQLALVLERDRMLRVAMEAAKRAV